MGKRKQNQDTVEIEELPDLTEKQFCFVDNLLSGKGIAESYRACYDCENMKDTTIQVEASKLRHNQNITMWLNAAKIAGMTKAQLTVETHLKRLEELSIKAELSGNYGAAVTAEVQRGKAVGIYVEQRRDLTNDPADLFRRLKAIMGEVPTTQYFIENLGFTQEDLQKFEGTRH